MASLPGNGISGQLDRTQRFHIGDAMVSKVDMNSHEMRVFRNGKLVRTIPITTGEQPKFATRSGIKVIGEKPPDQADELRDHRHRPEQRRRL